MKKSLLFMLPLTALLISGCRGGNNPTTTITSEQPTTATISPTSGTISPTSTTQSGGPTVAPQHVTKISISPSKPFINVVNGTTTMTCSVEGSPTDPNEKTCTWTAFPANAVNIEILNEYCLKAKVTFLKTGKVTIKCTNNYNTDLVDSVDVEVFENSEYVSVWNCSSNDKNQFNDGDNAKVEGDVTLGTNKWHFHRYGQNIIPVSGSQVLKFGNATNNPEGKIDFSLSNSKKVSKIVVGCSSKARVISVDPVTHYETTEDWGSSNLTIKVGETTIMNNEHTPKGDTPEKMEAIAQNSPSGDILISLSESVGYIDLQYIVVVYSHTLEKIEIDATSPHKTTFFKNETFSYEGLKVNATYENDANKYDVSNDIVVTPIDTSTLGNKTVTVSYTDGIIKQTTYNVEVIDQKEILSVEIVGEFTKTTYFVGDKFDYSGFNVKVTWIDTNVNYYSLPTSDGGDYTDVNIPEFATLDHNNGFEMSLKFKDVPAYHLVLEGTIVVSQNAFSIDFEGVGSDWGSTYKEHSVLDSTGEVFRVTATKSKKGDDSTNNYPCLSGESIIYIETLNENISIKEVDLEFEQYINQSSGEGKSQTVTVSETFIGKSVSTIVGTTSTFEFISSSFHYGTNFLILTLASKSNQIGLKNFTIKIAEENSAVVPLNGLISSGTLAKTSYSEGEDFDPKGLTIYATFTDKTHYPDSDKVDVTSEIIWDALFKGDTSATGTFIDRFGNESYIEINGITVTSHASASYSRVTSLPTEAGYKGEYLIVCEEAKAAWNGALDKDSAKASGNAIDLGNSIDTKSGTIEGSVAIDNATYVITYNTNGYYEIASKDNTYYLGITKSGSITTVTKSGDSTKLIFEFSVNDLICENMAYTTEAQFAYKGGNFVVCKTASLSEQYLSIQLYKIDD